MIRPSISWVSERPNFGHDDDVSYTLVLSCHSGRTNFQNGGPYFALSFPTSHLTLSNISLNVRLCSVSSDMPFSRHSAFLRLLLHRDGCITLCLSFPPPPSSVALSTPHSRLTSLHAIVQVNFRPSSAFFNPCIFDTSHTVSLNHPRPLSTPLGSHPNLTRYLDVVAAMARISITVRIV
jgi:hypothetical protein